MKNDGNYTLIVASSVFRETLMTFRIIVVSNEVELPATCSPNSECLPYIALIVPVVILVVLIAILVVVIIRQRKNYAGENATNT